MKLCVLRFFKSLLLVFALISVSSNMEARTINVKRYGAKGDGKSDDTKAIRSAVAQLKSGDCLKFPKGTYLVSVSQKDESIISLRRLRNIKMVGKQSSLVMATNGFTGYNLIKVENCNNVLIRNLVLSGDRVTHDYKTTIGTHEFGYGLYVVGDDVANVNVTICNCEIKDMTGDAIVTKNGISGGNIIIKDCDIHHCRRQGISVLDSDQILIEGCRIHNIGYSDGIGGTAPMAGIDIEPASGSNLVNKVVIKNSQISNTDYMSIVGNPTVFEMYNCNLEDLSLHMTSQGQETKGVIGSCEFMPTGSRRYLFSGASVDVYNSIFIYKTAAPGRVAEVSFATLKECYLEGASLDDGAYSLSYRCNAEACSFKDIRVISSDNLQMGKQSGNKYYRCDFLIYTTPIEFFENCEFTDCKTNSKYNPSVILKNCKLSKPLFKNQIEK